MAIQEDPNVPAAPRSDAAVGERLVFGRVVPPSHGVQWLVRGWHMFRRQAGMWVLLALVFVLMFVVVGAIPVLGQLAVTVLTPVFLGGMMIGCHKAARGEELELADLFAGFRRKPGALTLVGVIALVLTIAVIVSVMVITGASAMIAAVSGDGVPALDASAALATVLVLALALMVNMAVWFAPALIVLHKEPAARAMIHSFRACLRNIVPFLIYGAIVFVLAIIATIPLLLGWLVLGPVLVASVYAAYRDVFIDG